MLLHDAPILLWIVVVVTYSGHQQVRDVGLKTPLVVVRVPL